MKRIRFLSLGLALLLLGGCAAAGSGRALTPAPAGTGTAPVRPAPSAEADYALGAFGAALLAQVRQEGENTLVSPLSALLCLSMTANGAAGETLEAFLEVLGGGVSLEELNASCAALMEDYRGLEGTTRCNIANGLWIGTGWTADDGFLRRCADTYGAGLYQADLTAMETVKQVNAWVKEQTMGLIDGVLDRPLDAQAVLLLVNALYLKNAWAAPFDPAKTTALPFRSAAGTRQTEFLGNGVRQERYLQTERESGVVLPYDDGRLGFLAVLPKEGTDLTEYLSGWDGGTVPALLAAAEQTRLSLRLPKFEAEWGGMLNDALSTLGLGAAFDPDAADFSAMGTADGPIYIGSVMQKTRIQVNEKGTEAAAVTAAVMEAMSMPAEEAAVLILDRPFVYGIVDLERGVPLFLGTFEAP